MRLQKVYAGLPKTVGIKNAKQAMDREWTSAIFKEPVTDAVWVGKTGLTGDEQFDQKNHGGPEKAVFAYSSEHYTYWQTDHNITNISIGGMGENFVLENMNEDEVAIGDIYQIGEAIVQVSQPRQPCWKPARRFKTKNLALLIQNTGRTGWYFRVLKEGSVKAGEAFTLLQRPYPQWTIGKCNEIMHGQKQDFEQLKELAACEFLAPSLQDTLQRRVEKQETPDIQNRVFGPNA
ncbi:MOSC domain-containing protein [Neobacillus cucumis]|uniref:MOSC domain-containing protein n=1 Tax=Neobacillus cucumis TaxID=1740721 RepID=UPI0019636EA9|nr:MOSC domain-containing protein [Neobacillus cucumis]MBM7650866.1 MOSC domain-containing protein YiiM [Neobacillus cucumis]